MSLVHCVVDWTEGRVTEDEELRSFCAAVRITGSPAAGWRFSGSGCLRPEYTQYDAWYMRRSS